MARRLPGSKAPRDREAPARASVLPSGEELLRFIQDNPDQAGRREIARAFGLKGSDRIWLKEKLRLLEEEGTVTRKRKRLARPGELPPVGTLKVFGRSPDGQLLARSNGETDGPVVLIGASRGKGPAPGVGDRVLAKIFRNEGERGETVWTARVMKVLARREDALLGVVRRADDGSLRLDPTQKRLPEMRIEADDLNGAEIGDLVEAEAQRSAYGLPRARVLSVIGSLQSEKAVSMIAIHEHGIPHIFPAEVMAEAEAAKLVPLASREDWRDLPLVTIDPADAKDHDDAVHGEPDTDDKNPGGVVVTVAIADVAAYVRSGTALDREAWNRGNSVYFPDRVVPMLPERISNDLCSLREGVERPALAVRMVFSSDGRKIRHSFHRILMRSHARLAYPQAQAAIDGNADEKTAPLLETILRPLWDAYAVLKRGRAAREPLELDLPERKILLKPDGSVDRVIVPERLDAHKLIEEMMIQANVAAAETLEGKRQKLLFRVHDAPSLAKQESLRDYLRGIGMTLARGPALRPGAFNAILTRVQGSASEELTNEVVLRSQSQAEYSPANIGHFGLNLLRYAHFTSPIRRYADLVVHRALIGALGLGPDGLQAAEEARLEETGTHISQTERRAMAAERDTVDRLVATHLAGRTGEVFSGRVSGVTKSGLFVQLPEYGADGFIPISTLGDDYYIFDEATRSLVGRSSGEGFQLADRVEVRLVHAAPVAGAMQFAIESEPKKLSGDRRSFHKATKGRARERASVGRARRR
ncbi:MAG: ribonuclease R [Mesorhizobium amorphae]|nr:MAG: ribonuclease R [Mesorhizobium amorphae]